MIRLPFLGLSTAALFLAGCASTGPSDQASTSSGSSGSTAIAEAGRCDAGSVQNLVGQPYSERQAETARSRSGAATLRTLMPGQVMTMEYRPTRLTVVVGDKQEIASLRCG